MTLPEASPANPVSAAEAIDAPRDRRARWFEHNFELVIALLLGIASIITAWASYQASLYDGEMAAANTRAGVLAAEAESQYLEGNQQYVSDAQLFDRLSELNVQANSADPNAADIATQTVDLLKFQSMTDAFSAAIDWADAENEADPETFTHPQASEEYQAHLFGGYEETKAEADAALLKSGAYNDLGDQLTLATVLLAISLFLFGIAALIRSMRTRYLLTGISTLVMLVATVISVMVVSSPVS